MSRRWIPRLIVLTLLAVILCWWAWSYFSIAYVHYGGKYTYRTRTYTGVILFELIAPLPHEHGWQFSTRRGGSGLDRDWLLYGHLAFEDYRLFGFAAGRAYSDWGHRLPSTYWHYRAEIPFWFPALLAAILCCYVFRKTRLIRADNAFPVEQTPSIAANSSNPGA